MEEKIDIYLEVGKQRTIAAALDWPGWCRTGKEEETAVQSLLAYGARYARVVGPARLVFQAPGEVSAFRVVERLKGNGTTDFGVPGLIPAGDQKPLDDAGLRRLQKILKACWQAFDAGVKEADGKALRLGPRGGGRTLEGIVEHVVGAEAGYLSRLGGKAASSEVEPLRQAILETLVSSAHGEVATHGPRGAKRWPARYFVRREAWHVLDHLWEIEDRRQD